MSSPTTDGQFRGGGVPTTLIRNSLSVFFFLELFSVNSETEDDKNSVYTGVLYYVLHTFRCCFLLFFPTDDFSPICSLVSLPFCCFLFLFFPPDDFFPFCSLLPALFCSFLFLFFPTDVLCCVTCPSLSSELTVICIIQHYIKCIIMY